jgi:hypothetical protein
VLVGGMAVGVCVGAFLLIQARRRQDVVTVNDVLAEVPNRETWRMPALQLLERPSMSMQRKVGLILLRTYLAIVFILVIVKIVEVAVK